MKAQIITIVLALVSIPLVYWYAKTSYEKQKVQKVEDWNKYWDWVAKHPQEIAKYPDMLRRVRSPRAAEWVGRHPDVAAAISAALANAPLNNGNGVAPVPSATTPTAPVAPVTSTRQAFLDQIAKQGSSVDAKLTTKTITARLDTTGATIATLQFNDLKESSFKPVSASDPPVSELGPYQLLRPWDKAESFALTVPKSADMPEELDKVEWLYTEIPGGHRFTRVLPDGELKVTKEYLLPTPVPGNEYSDYHFILRVSVENLGAKPRIFGYTLYGPAGLIPPTTSSQLPLQAVIALKDEHGGFSAERKSFTDVFSDVKDKKPSLNKQAPGGNRISFYGLVEKQFACAVVPLDEKLAIDSASADTLLDVLGRAPTAQDEAALKAPEDSLPKQITVRGTRSSFVVAPGTTVSQDYMVYAGPLWKGLLDGHPAYVAADLGSLVDYKSWWPLVPTLAFFLTKLLVGFHYITRSWGLSIVLLTVLVRACLHPLMVKQTKSTQKMQSLQPEINKLKEKYQDKDGNMSPEDSKKFQAEQMELWKKHGINPLGCMGPMLLQLPIFIGLWNALTYAFELRQSSFLWIRDLTEPDVVFRLPFKLPMHGMNAFCVLPLLMLVVYIFQMKSMPKASDPQQAEQQKMMQWVMPVMGYMFYSVSSGLLLYYITSALLGMAEQRWIKKRLGITTPGQIAPAM